MFYSEEAAYDYTLSHDDRGYNQQPASPATMPQPKQASSATRELDDLMATLSEFKVGFEIRYICSGQYSIAMKNLIWRNAAIN